MNSNSDAAARIVTMVMGAVEELPPNWWNAVCSRYPAETVGCGE